jgi:hypothetical protein
MTPGPKPTDIARVEEKTPQITLEERAARLVPKALRTVKHVMMSPTASNADRLKAAEQILDRAAGNARQYHDITERRAPAKLSNEELFAEAEKIMLKIRLEEARQLNPHAIIVDGEIDDARDYVDATFTENNTSSVKSE